MSSKKTDQVSAPPVKPSIDSVLDQGESSWKPYLNAVKFTHRPASPDVVTPPPSPPGRPGASTRPSWIGPKPAERPNSPGIANMKHTVTIEYSSPALQPPVFIFTNLSDPQWEAVVMEAEKVCSSGEWRFHKTFSVERGEYQYKFRLGPGDWWVTDESKTVVDDGQGNKNNLLVVKEDTHADPSKHIDLMGKTDPTPSLSFPANIEMPPAVLAAQQTAVTPAPGPLMGHELFGDDQPASQPQPKTDEVPRLPHEPEHLGSVLKKDIAVEEEYSDVNDGEDHEDECPLLRHESLSATSAEQEHSPLFRHESASIGMHTGSPKAELSRRSSAEDMIPAEADPEDTSLEQFPTSRLGIYERIRHTSLQLAEDQTKDLLQDERDPDITAVFVGSEEGEDNSTLEKLHKIEEEEAERENQEEGDPLLPEIVLTEVNGDQMTKAEEFIKRETEEMLAGETTAQEDDDQEERSKIIAEFVQSRGPFGTAIDVLRNPLCWVGTVGLALAVVAGWYKLRYA